VLIVMVGAVGCGAAPAPTDEFYDVSGHIESADGKDRTCFLSVYTYAGTPVGETAQVVQPDEPFSWPLRRGQYRLEAACDDASGEVSVDVPTSRDLEIVVQ
jgi:hypothetical protein